MGTSVSRVRVTGAPRVSVGGLRGLNSAIRSAGLTGTAGADLSARLREAAELCAGVVRANAAGFSSRVPGTVRVGGGRSGVYIRAGGPKGPAAYTAETAARHPLFGLPGPWYQGPVHPFLAPAADETADAMTEIVARVIDDWAREYGLAD